TNGNKYLLFILISPKKLSLVRISATYLGPSTKLPCLPSSHIHFTLLTADVCASSLAFRICDTIEKKVSIFSLSPLKSREIRAVVTHLTEMTPLEEIGGPYLEAMLMNSLLTMQS